MLDESRIKDIGLLYLCNICVTACSSVEVWGAGRVGAVALSLNFALSENVFLVGKFGAENA